MIGYSGEKEVHMEVALKAQKIEGRSAEIKEWGSCLSELLIEPSFQEFRAPGISGFIGYLSRRGFAIVIGDPVCSQEDLEKLNDAFHAFAKKNNIEIIYFCVSETFAHLNFPKLCPIKIQVGNELIFDPFNNLLEGHKGSRLRNKIQFTKKNGITFSEYYVPSPKTENALNQLVKEWGKLREGPQLYLTDVLLFDQREGRRWFYIKHGERFIGVALLTEMNAHEGWLLKYHIVLPDAPRGATELLLLSILDTLRDEKCHFLTYGVMPVSDLTDIEGLGPFSKWTAQRFFKIIKWFFDLDSRKTFWEKFQPLTKPVYLLFSSPRFSPRQIYALMKILKIKF